MLIIDIVLHFDNTRAVGKGLLRRGGTLAISRSPLLAWEAALDCRQQPRR
jgi:hypothetical protein